MTELIYKEEAYNIIGAAMEVHKELGCGFLEAVYQEAFELELQSKGIPYVREQKLEIYYKGKKMAKYYVADFIFNEDLLCISEDGANLLALVCAPVSHHPSLKYC